MGNALPEIKEVTGLKKAKVTIHPEYAIGPIDKRLFSGYMEPLGNLVYGGIWNPDHPEADELGLRKDVMKAIQEFGVPAVRLPGGNVTSGWNWKDSIGPREKRKQHLDLAWRQYEPNWVGHDEYLAWARRCGMEPMYTVNMGTGTIEDAMHCIEYTNHPGGTYWSDLRRKNGFTAPHNVKTWYLGNEMDGPWQIHSWEKDPKGYGVKINEAAKALKWVDPSITTVASGTSTPLNHTYPQWDVDVLEECYENIDMLSLHYYHNVPEGDMAAFMSAPAVFEEFIRTEIAACDFVQAKLCSPKQITISFDEFGVGFAPAGKTAPGRKGRIPHETYGEFSEQNLNRPFREIDPNHWPERKGKNKGGQMLGAIASAAVMMTFLRHSDRIKIGCMTGSFLGALSINREHVWKSIGYYPFKHYLEYANGISLLPSVKSPSFCADGFNINEFYQCHPYENIPYIQAGAAYDEEKGELSIFLLNLNWEEAMEVELDVRGFEGYRLKEHIELYSNDPSAADTWENPDAVLPKKNSNTSFHDGKIELTAQKLSWNVIRLTKE